MTSFIYLCIDLSFEQYTNYLLVLGLQSETGLWCQVEETNLDDNEHSELMSTSLQQNLSVKLNWQSCLPIPHLVLVQKHKMATSAAVRSMLLCAACWTQAGTGPVTDSAFFKKEGSRVVITFLKHIKRKNLALECNELAKTISSVFSLLLYGTLATVKSLWNGECLNPVVYKD